MKKTQHNKLIALNKKANFNYFILEKYEAGIQLFAGEVKACQNKNVILSDGYISIINNQLLLNNIHISNYKYNFKNYNETRQRNLLMHKKEILKLALKIQNTGYSLIPLSMYFNQSNFIKIEIALVKGKHNYDKRETLKNKELQHTLRNL